MQKNRKRVLFGNLGMAGHTHLKWYCQFEEIFDVFLQAKSQLHYSHFQRYCKLVILGTLGKPGYAYAKWYYHLVEKFCI